MFIFLICNLFASPVNVWKKPPEVLICDNDIPEQIVNNSIEQWNKKEYSIEKLSKRHTCIFESKFYMQSAIMIYVSDNLEDKTLGATTNYRYNDGRIAYSIIEISREALYLNKVYEHEIGHALGLSHSDTKEDVMFPKFDLNLQ